MCKAEVTQSKECFPDMKHILDNYMISDVRLTTGERLVSKS
jgi:hypothetical protein